MIIYKATNLVNGKVYIGQTRYSLEHRKQQHFECAKQGVNTHFYQAIRKYGEDAFSFEIVCSTKDKKVLNELEIYYIEKYNSIKNGYNMVAGGNSNIMDDPKIKFKHKAKMTSDEMRNRISNTLKQYRKEHPFSEEHRQRLSNAMKGNHNFGSGDTRSIQCYCVIDGKEYHFHSYLEAGKWWYENYKPFPYSEGSYQSKIKQSIKDGYATYGRNNDKVVFDYIRWYKEEGDRCEKVTGKK